MTTDEIDRAIKSQTIDIEGIIEEMQRGVSEARAFEITSLLISVGRQTAPFIIKTVADIHKLRSGQRAGH